MAPLTEWPHFSHREIACRCGCGFDAIDQGFMTRIVALRAAAGYAMPMTSGCRCPAHNAAEGGEALSAHMEGLAGDFHVYGAIARKILELAFDMRFSGIGILQHGPGDGRLIHLDDAPPIMGRHRPLVWTYPGG